VHIVGLIMCIVGDTIRKTAILTAQRNFTHQVQYVRRPNHVLVTNGLYNYCRHPSYMGWFYWSIGTQVCIGPNVQPTCTQLALCNPVCTIIYALAAWYFFSERIDDEEQTLLRFFGHQYFDYQRKVPRTGVPFIVGHIVAETAVEHK
jgi:protein-S-isoprenylcysteine O-methyltransferase